MIFELDHFLFPFFVISVYIFFAFALPPSKFILPDINILKHSRQQVDDAQQRFKSAEYNFNVVGTLLKEDISNAIELGFVSKEKSVVVGKGRADFLRATAIMMSFNMTNILKWIEIIPSSDALRAGDPIFTNSRFYSTPLWTLNPCKIVSVKVTGDGAHILYATTVGHLIAGEEIFRVFLQPQSENVVFEIQSISKGAGWLGTVCLPLIRPLQDRFLRENMVAMRQIMDAEKMTARTKNV